MENSVKSKKRGKKSHPINDSSKCNDEKPEHTKSKKKQKSNSNLIDENLEPSNTNLMPMKKSKKMEDMESEITFAPKSKKKKQKVKEHVDSENTVNSSNPVELGNDDDEMDVDSSVDDESDISDGESANSVSSFNIDSYPSDSDEGDDDASEDEEANKKRGLPVGAVPSAELEERENRTIFVGNLPKTVERHQLQKWFSRFGKVECVRLRSAPIADLELPKKVAVIKKSFHDNRSNIHAYIRYKDVEGAQNALQANCTKYNDYVIRVDHARHKGGYDGKKAVFVGNVPFSIEENSLIGLFSKCGEIDGVRIIRDKETGVGKGFAYVNFKCTSSVPLALKLDGEVLEKRQLRVKPVKYDKKSYKLPSKFSQVRNNSKFKSGPIQYKSKGFGEMKKNGSSRKPPFKKNKFQGELSKRKERSKFKKKSFATKKREIYSKILANKKKAD
ncbi:RNA-binding protein 34 [Halyomorpha halys]|uniref:RNA-binding protein 34 n=1 Tax=Halyomorpha halys TaxID=286706 RepID=UPI0006D4DFB6|nr:RNA-binding protein 34 [Halyomorpha halys]